MKKVVFLGGKQIGYDCLRCLCLHPKVKVALVISNLSDLYEGKDRWYPKIYELAKDNEISYIATDDINTADMAAKIRGVSPDFIFVVYYDKILKPTIFNIPKEGSINLHLADAEKYKGCYPTTYAIINGETEYGVTLHYIDKGVDTGRIIDKVVFELKNDWIGKDLYYAASKEGYKLFERNIDNILSGSIKSRPQKPSTSIHHYKRSQFPSHEIPFEGEAKATLNQIRALLFPPFPAPYFRLGDKKYVIAESQDYSDAEG